MNEADRLRLVEQGLEEMRTTEPTAEQMFAEGLLTMRGLTDLQRRVLWETCVTMVRYNDEENHG